MEQNLANTSANGKAEYCKRFILLGKIAEIYAGDRKMIKQLAKQLKRDKKNFSSERYPFTDEDRREIFYCFTELGDILNRLLNVSEVTRYKIAARSLGEFIAKLEAETAAAAPTVAQRAVNAVKDAARSFGDAVKSLGEKIDSEVEEIKKTVKGANSK